ncbi:pinin [Toxorhynchites rutilus septentrionalis]|uniref:pinin n=1 Tax=Toxorhynchites rutilus septentrionalis TaxID=329112 RepID=UPI00247981EC|nr:pinin [Toxorhynchites rutilus septentrionalis]
MATEVIKGYTDLQQELNRARDNLKGLNENIRKIIGRDPSITEQYNAGNSFGAYSRIEARKRNVSVFEQGRRPEQERRFSDGIQNPVKRRMIGETKSVFSRLSGPPNRDNEYEKPRIHSRVIKEQPTRQEIVAAQGDDEQSRARNRRIFGSLLGTLQKFSQEESKLKSKEEKKALIEKKLEEQQKIERENMRKEKHSLFTDRKRQQLQIRAIETKMAKMKDLETWQESKRLLGNFIKTKTKPHIYFLPKTMDSKMEKKLKECKEEHAKNMEQRRQEVMDSIAGVEARFKADLQNLEENMNRDKSEIGEDNANSAKHNRSAGVEDDDDLQDDDHPTSPYNDQTDVIEGPALPSAMVSANFKITIHNNEIKQEKVEASPKIVRLVEGPATPAINKESTPESASYLAQGENFQITFKTDRATDL